MVNDIQYKSSGLQRLTQQLEILVSRRRYWFQLDGAPCHCTTANLIFSSGKFNRRVISRRISFPWSTHSPDLSPLDYLLWNELD